MAENSEISWTDHTFNPWIGCAKVSPGCAHCYAETLMDTRYGKVKWGKGNPRQRTRAANWKLPLRWNREAIRWVQCSRCGWRGDSTEHCGCDPLCRVPTRPRVFCASLSDWLDDEVPTEWLADLLKLIHDTPNLDWLLLTKRPNNWEDRIAAATEHMHPEGNMASEWLTGEPDRIPANVWIGTTTEDQQRADERIPELLKIPAKVRFLSVEPMLGPVNIPSVLERCLGWNTDGSDKSWWPPGHQALQLVICGGESGRGARPMHPDWARSLRDQCAAAGVPFHFKQWGEFAPCQRGSKGEIEVRTPAGVRTPRNPEFHRWPGDQISARVGKHAAGRLLDGQTHDAFPAV